MQAAKEGDATKVDKRRKKKQKQAEEDAAFLDDPDQDAEYQDGALAASYNAVCMLSHLMPVIRCWPSCMTSFGRPCRAMYGLAKRAVAV